MEFNPDRTFSNYKILEPRKEETFQTSWEQTRIQIYYQFCSYPKKGRNPSFAKFKQEHLPFYWDKISSHTEEEETEDKVVFSADDWMKRLEQIKNAPREKITNPEGF